MAVVSAPQANSALTPPSSSHGVQDSWTYSVPSQRETPAPSSRTNDYAVSSERLPLASKPNGHHLVHQHSRPDLSRKRTDTYNSSHSSRSNHPGETEYLAPARVNALGRKDSSISDTGSAPDSFLDLYSSKADNNSMDHIGGNGTNGDIYDDDEDPEHSRWIHRDKLARIESQELQAAGIILPRSRAQSTQSKSSRQRERSRDQQGNGYSRSEQSQKRQKVAPFPAEEESQENIGWDLRLPEEAADDPGDFYRDVSGGVKGISRIPIAKTSPLPIPTNYLERDTPVPRKQSVGQEDESISYPKSRRRSQSMKMLEDASATPTPGKRLTSADNSPTKRPRKGTAPSSRNTSGQQRPKNKSGSRDTSGQQRPTTRSGDLNGSSKKPEGDPPWLASMYKPDPRLPPDQQLLPTVAKRLQQEQWEKEGKFGNVYDKEFRPLNDDPYPEQREFQQSDSSPEPKPEEQAEWPLRPTKSPSQSNRPGTAGGQGSYSTMPKIPSHTSDRAQNLQPMPSPKPKEPIRVQEPPEDDKKKGGCGCCVIM